MTEEITKRELIDILRSIQGNFDAISVSGKHITEVVNNNFEALAQAIQDLREGGVINIHGDELEEPLEVQHLDPSIMDHGNLTNVTADQHHAKGHAHDGVDSSGTVTHGDTTGRTADDHHARDHAARHEPGGVDPMGVDAVAAVGSLRTLGANPQQAAAGDHGPHGGGTHDLDFHDAVSVSMPTDGHILIFREPSTIDGGLASTTVFDATLDGGLHNTTVWDDTLDGGGPGPFPPGGWVNEPLPP